MTLNRRKVESLAEAIMKYSGYLNPESDVYFARNPGGLKAYSPSHARDEHGTRIFVSVLDGIQALLYDIDLKLSGKSRAQLKATDTFVELAAAYSLPTTTAQVWVKFMRRALRDEAITTKTPLSYFEEN